MTDENKKLSDISISGSFFDKTVSLLTIKCLEGISDYVLSIRCLISCISLEI